MIRHAEMIAMTLLLGAGCCHSALGQAPGASWTRINAGLPNSFFGITTLTVDPSSPSTLYAITLGGSLFKSTDAAASWRAVSGVLGLSFLAIDPKNSSTTYAATQHGIIKSTDGGENWNAANGNLTDTCFMLVIDPITPTTVYGLSNGPIFKTTNAGETWKPIHATASPNIAGSLVIDPVTPSTIYASITNTDIVKSTDGGESWVVIKTGLPLRVFSPSVMPLAVDPRVPSTLYAGSFAASRFNASPPFDTGAGSISRSTDGGQSWDTVRAGIPSEAFVRSLALDPASPSTIYAAYSSADVGGVLKSTDGGQSWTVIDTANFQGAWIAVDTGTSSTIYAAYSAYSGAGTISKSTDAGSSWKPSNEGLAFPDLHVMAIDPVSATTVYTGGAGGVFKSDDAGGHWNNLAAFQLSSLYPPATGPAAVRSLLINSKNPTIVYAEALRVNGGCAIDDKDVFKSTDGGATWSDRISPPDSGCILGAYEAYSTVMAMDPADSDTLYLGETEAEDGFYSLLKSTDGGANWSSIWNAANGLHSGLNTLAIDPVTPTTLYAGVGDSGFKPGTTGVFKSTDGGASWNVTSLKDTAVTVLTIDRTDPSILYVGTQGIYTKPDGFRGLFKSTDGGATWAAINDGLTSLVGGGATITSVVIAPNHSNIVYAATSGDGVYKSTDGGGNWVRFNDGLTNLNIRALAIVPGTQTTLYAATPGGVFRAVDDTSQPVNLPLPSSPQAAVNSPVEVTVNGKAAEVVAAVGYPGTADGYQVNFRVPSDAAKGPATVQVGAAWIAGPAVSIVIQ
jgi:uncharacterized protein (TIGR03437 family)